MRSDDVEAALQAILGPLVASPGLVITLRRHDEYELLIERIRALEAQVQRQDQELRAMSNYPVLYLQALDELWVACKLLDQLGVDTSFVSSFRRRSRRKT